MAEPLDTVFQVHTPEYSEFRFYLAGVFERMIACAIDHLLVLVLFLVIVLVGGAFPSILGSEVGGLVTMGGVLLGVFVRWTYFILWEGLWGGRTPGKRVMRLRVVSQAGRPIHLKQAVVRNLLREVDMIPAIGLLPLAGSPKLPFYGIGFGSSFVSRRNQRMGDLAAHTVVIKEKASFKREIEVVDREALRQEIVAIPKGIFLSRQQSGALAAYVQRRATFGEPRREELARPFANALRRRYGIASIESHDALLCAVYVRVLGGDA